MRSSWWTEIAVPDRGGSHTAAPTLPDRVPRRKRIPDRRRARYRWLDPPVRVVAVPTVPCSGCILEFRGRLPAASGVLTTVHLCSRYGRPASHRGLALGGERALVTAALLTLISYERTSMSPTREARPHSSPRTAPRRAVLIIAGRSAAISLLLYGSRSGAPRGGSRSSRRWTCTIRRASSCATPPRSHANARGRRQIHSGWWCRKGSCAQCADRLDRHRISSDACDRAR